MLNKSFGFIGGGRVAKILLQAMNNKGMMPAEIVVSDVNADVLEKLQNQFPKIKVTQSNVEPAKCDYVFISLHPPVLAQTLNDVNSHINHEAIVISLAPKITIEKIENILGKDSKVVRMIPNAPSIINQGYNPVVYSKNISAEEKSELALLFEIFGEYPEVDEYNLEGYAILTAMGPTYLWFQLHQLQELGSYFGLTDEELKKGIPAMVKGAVDTMFESGLNCNEIIDLIPVKPLANNEESIVNMYRNNLTTLFDKLKNQ